MIMWLYLLICILGIFGFHLKRSRSYWAKRSVPALTSINHMLDLMGRKHMSLCIKDHYDTYKKTSNFVGMYIFDTPVLIPTNLDFIKQILIKDFNYFPDRQIYHNEKDDPLSAHLFSIGGEKWRIFRNHVSPAFTIGKLKLMYPFITQHTDVLIKYLKERVNDEPQNFRNICTKFAADVIGLSAFGFDCKALETDSPEILRVSEQFFNFNNYWARAKLFILLNYENFAKKLRLRFNTVELEKFFMKIIKDTIKARESGTFDRNDFIKILLKINKNNADYTMTADEMAAQAFIFFFGGYETSSMTLQYCCAELAQNQDIQDRVRQETRDVLLKYNGELTYDAAHELTYLKQCIDETLRMYPAGFNLFRCAINDYKVPNSSLVIEKGTRLFIPLYSIHMDPDLYPKPHTFDPERFTKENIANRHPMAYLPFGDGPRYCIGMRYAIMELLVALSNIIDNFKLTLNPKTKTPFIFHPQKIIIAPKDDIYIDLQPLK